MANKPISVSSEKFQPHRNRMDSISLSPVKRHKARFQSGFQKKRSLRKDRMYSVSKSKDRIFFQRFIEIAFSPINPEGRCFGGLGKKTPGLLFLAQIISIEEKFHRLFFVFSMPVSPPIKNIPNGSTPRPSRPEGTEKLTQWTVGRRKFRQP